LLRTRITYPGPLNVVHSWAYLPDFAATLVQLAAMRERFEAFETFGFPGHAVTGHELIAAIERATGRKYNVRQMGWWMLKSFGRLLAIGRELAELEYLWRVPHRIDGTRLASVLGEVPHTPLDQAVAQALRELGYRV
jgi:nucleoside-diphosphate-sugar epimerase